MRTTLAMTLAGLFAAGLWVLMEPDLGAPSGSPTPGVLTPGISAPSASALATPPPSASFLPGLAHESAPQAGTIPPGQVR